MRLLTLLSIASFSSPAIEAAQFQAASHAGLCWQGVADSHREDTAPSIGPFVLYNRDSSSSVRFQCAGQLRFQFLRGEQRGDVKETSRTQLVARRIRPTLTGSFYHSLLTFKLHLSVAPGSLELMDFYFDYNLSHCMRLRYGQYKVPFTYYRLRSFQQLNFVEWALVTRYFGAERQMGVTWHNGYEATAAFNYVLGVFTGTNARSSHAVGLPESYNVEVPNPSDLGSPADVPEFHPEIFLHTTYAANSANLLPSTSEASGGLCYLTGFSVGYDFGPMRHQDFTLRVAPELLLKYQRISLFIVGYAGWAEMGSTDHTDLAMTGGLFQAAYQINHRYEISIRYAIVNFADALINDASTSTQRQEELTVAFNIYFTGHSLKWHHDAGWLRHTLTSQHLSDYLVRSQFQLAF